MFFFKQKTAYERRISDWSSDVCSSDLLGGVGTDDGESRARCSTVDDDIAAIHRPVLAVAAEIEGGIDARRLARGVEIPGQAQDADRPVCPQRSARMQRRDPLRAWAGRLQCWPPHRIGGIEIAPCERARSEEHTAELQSL